MTARVFAAEQLIVLTVSWYATSAPNIGIRKHIIPCVMTEGNTYTPECTCGWVGKAHDTSQDAEDEYWNHYGHMHVK